MDRDSRLSRLVLGRREIWALELKCGELRETKPEINKNCEKPPRSRSCICPSSRACS